MLRLRTRLFAGLIAVAFTPSVHAQWWGGSGCSSCGQTAAAPPMMAMNPCCNPQPVCMTAIPKTEYRDVAVTEFRPVKKSVQMPVCKTVYVDKPITVVKQVMEQKTCDVQTVSYQNVPECKQVCQNRGYWQTIMQPVPKMAPCQYDQRPTLLGELNRLGYYTRMAFTPDYIPRREYVPQVQMVNVQVNRVVAVPSVRQVSYNVPRMVTETVNTRVAQVVTEMESREVTAMEPFTTTKRMAVGTTYQYAYIDPATGTATALAPTPADERVPRRADAGDSNFKGISTPIQNGNDEPQPTLADPKGPVAAAPLPAVKNAVIHTVGWRATTREAGGEQK